ncbi:hypothetical protein [Methylopila sp. Yamaguchi]|uniref:hypothetical protein n=1 Tax=Methylopila sp. Yamaguchi TaxID=1437817 RepID=UPI0011AF8D2A|nr:hypothetical protein [Methylopila sp. Yamaguchi]
MSTAFRLLSAVDQLGTCVAAGAKLQSRPRASDHRSNGGLWATLAGALGGINRHRDDARSNRDLADAAVCGCRGVFAPASMLTEADDVRS